MGFQLKDDVLASSSFSPPPPPTHPHTPSPFSTPDPSPFHEKIKNFATRLAGLDTYVALPPSDKAAQGIVLLITDIFGAHRKNPKLWADRLAASAGGFAVVLPDFFRGDAWPADAELSTDRFKAWLAKHPKDRVLPEAQAVVKAAAAKFSPDPSKPLPVSVVGFCWGALYATLLAGGPKPEVASVALLHPSLLTLEEFEAVEAPTLVLFTANDSQVSDSFRAEIIEVLYAKNKEKKPPTAHRYYDDQAHGFSLRGDDTDPKVAAAAGDAFDRTAAWLKEHGSSK